MLGLTVIGVFLLATLWEFAVEDALNRLLFDVHAKGIVAERWEFVLTSTGFAAIALIVPALLSLRLVKAESRAKRALAASESKYQALLETTNVIPWEADAVSFQFTYVGPQAEALLGYPLADWYQNDFWPRHIHPDDREATVRSCLEATRLGHDHDFEYRMIAADGRTVWLRDIVTNVKQAGVPKLLRGVMIDITERKRMEAALRLSEGRYRDFAADVAHELRTPLALLRSHLDTLADTATNRSLRRDVDGMSRLVSQLMALTRLDSLATDALATVDLHQIAVRVAEQLAPIAIRERRSIEITGVRNPVVVPGNADALEMAVRNLVENAIRYSARNTTVTISVSDAPAISVIDRGRGIPPENRELIFQRFERADRRRGGAGLGLAIVRRTVEAHGAGIDVADAAGGGTVFTIRFPTAAPAPKAIAS
ncbi:MAG: PAS domain-containing sensor histidine kinase [Rhodospirillales bacterium]|nr:PAS domain-containing sensor histidine kinase [Rhodospirillales bacterium]